MCSVTGNASAPAATRHGASAVAKAKPKGNSRERMASCLTVRRREFNCAPVSEDLRPGQFPCLADQIRIGGQIAEAQFQGAALLPAQQFAWPAQFQIRLGHFEAVAGLLENF